MTNESDFDWGPRGEQFFRDLAAAAGVKSELAIKFFAAKTQEATNSKAASLAGAGGNPANAGYRLSRSKDVERLAAAAHAEAGVNVGLVDRAEARRILSAMARGADHTVKLRAIELLSRLEAQDHDHGAALDSDGRRKDRFVRDMILDHGSDGAAAAVMTLCAVGHLALSRVPLFWDLIPRLQSAWPEIYGKLLQRQSPVMLEDLQERFDDPKWQLHTRQTIWGEVGWVVDQVTNEALRDPLGRAHIKSSVPEPTINTNANGSFAEQGPAEPVAAQ